MNKLKFLLFKYSIKRFVPLTSGTPRKRLSKPVLFIFAIALVFAILGVIDLKVNAAESQYLELYYEFGLREDTSQIYDGWYYSDWNGLQRTCVFDNNYTYALLRSDYVKNNVTVGYTYTIYCGTIGGSYSSPYVSTNNSVSAVPVKQYYRNSDDVPNGKYTNVSTDICTWNTELYPDLLPATEYSYMYISHNTNLPVFTDTQGLADYYATGDLSGQYKPPIDYDALEVDDSMPVPENFVLNKLYDDKQVFDYIEWTNTSDLSIQVQVCPISVVYENKNLGFSYGNWIDSFDGDYFHEEHLWPLSYNYTFEVFNPKKYYTGMEYAYPEALEHFEKIDAEQDNGTFGSVNLYHTFGYRFRYYDLDSMKAGPWIHVWPDRTIGKYVSYIVYSDDSFSNDVNASGIEQEFTGSTLEEAIGKVKDELTFKDKYDIVDGDADVTEVTGWLKSVVGFIKSTPSVIGSVLGFLPQPILYGMYVVLFLGVIAAGYAIIRALI